MKLTDLNPKWITVDGKRCGVRFDCPCCRSPEGAQCLVAVPLAPPLDDDKPLSTHAAAYVAKGWARTGDTFETLTLSPSIWVKGGACKPDGSGWHGFVKDGEISTC